MKNITALSPTLSWLFPRVVLALVAQILWFDPPVSHAQTVLARARLGNNGEDMEFIPSGRYANQLAIIDGYDVLAIPVLANGRGGAHKLFDVKKLPLTGGPRGIGYVESERLFVFTDITFGDQLLFANEDGNAAGTRTITFPVDVESLGCESVSYIRRGSRFFPDHLLLVIYAAPDFSQRIEVVRRDGVVVAEIVPEDTILAEHGCASACYISPDRILLGTFDGLVFLTDLTGKIVAGPSPANPNSDSCEGVAQTADGRLVATSYTSGKVVYFDRQLNRLPNADQSYQIGIGLTRPVGPAWNPDSNEFLFTRGDAFSASVESVPITLNARRTVVDLGADGVTAFQVRDITYLPDEHRIGVGTLNPNEIALYGQTGTREDTVDLSSLGAGPNVAQYLSGPRQFGVFQRGLANRGLVRIIGRDGTLTRTIDLRPHGVNFFSFAYFSGIL